MKSVGSAPPSIPFVIGVTGHRDLRPEDSEQIRSVVRDLLLDVQSILPHTSLRVLSPLAEGADRVVAEIALELGIELVAVLPFDVEEFEKDFQSPESIQEFRQLKTRAAGTVKIDAFPHAEARRFDVYDPKAIQYALAGAFVAEHCQLLIALWDGKDTGKVGGTRQVVHFVRSGIPISLRTHGDFLSQEELGDVAQVRVTRASESESEVPISLSVLTSTDEEPESLEQSPGLVQARRNLDVFNRHSRSKAPRATGGERSEPGADQAADIVSKQFHAADQLALRFQSAYLRAWVSILALSFAAAVTLQVHLNAVSSWVLSLVYGAIILIAFGIYYGVKLFRLEERYLDYRALAEGLRVQVHWLEAGISKPVSQFYLHRQQSELRWIRSAIRNATFAVIHLAPALGGVAALQTRVDGVKRNWIQDQLKYFAKATEAAQRAERRWTWAARIMLGVGVILAIVKSSVGHSPWLVVLVAVPPILVAIFTLHVQNRKFGPIAQQASRMASLFHCASKRLDEFQSASEPMDREFEQLLLQLGHEVLAENAEWVTLHRDRPISTPFVA